MKTIVVPLDSSGLAEQALPHVLLIARLISADVRLLHVVSEADRLQPLFEDTWRFDDAGRPIDRDRSWEILRRNGQEYLERQAAKLRREDLAVRTEVQLGNAPEAIVEASEHPDVAMVAMATHGYGGLRRWALGSVTDKVLHAIKKPALVVRGILHPHQSRAIRRILVPLDGSAFARKALPLAVELACRANAQLLLLTVAVPPVLQSPDSILAYGDFDEMVVEMRARLLDELGPHASVLHEHGVRVTPLAIGGSVPEAIVDEAEAERADLIVMATHGATGVCRWALGSVADKVLRASNTALILVNAHD